MRSCMDFFDDIIEPGHDEEIKFDEDSAVMSDYEINEWASSLYTGGWRSADADDLRADIDSLESRGEISHTTQCDFNRLIKALEKIEHSMNDDD